MVASWVKRFILYAPSPFISNRRAEPRRKLQTFSATQLLKKKKKEVSKGAAKPKLLNEAPCHPACEHARM